MFHRDDLCAWAILSIVYIVFLTPGHRRPFSKLAADKACGRDILRTDVWIAFKFDRVVLWVLLVICLTFGYHIL